MPSVMTCLVAKRLGNKLSDNHWDLRNFTANLVASICKRFGHVYHNLQPRVAKTMLHAFLDPSKALPQHYGAIKGLAALGPNVVRSLLLPKLETYLRLLEPEIQLEKQKNEIKRHEAWLVYGALTSAAGLCLYNSLKRISFLKTPSASAICKSDKKVLTRISTKRKASTNNTLHQSPSKKIAADIANSVLQSNSIPAKIPGTSGVYSADTASNISNNQQLNPSTDNHVQLQPSRPLTNIHVPSPRIRTEIGNGQRSKTLASFGQSWKDVDAGKLIPLLYDYFGEGMLSFVPSPYSSMFL